MRAETKTGLRPSFYMRETDIQVLRGSQLIHTTAHKVQTQGVMHHGENSKAFKAPASTPEFEPSDKARKDKKKKQHRDKRDSRQSRDTPASGVNATEVEIRKEGERRRTQRRLHVITATNWGTTMTSVWNLGSQKTSIGLDNLHVNDWY